VILETNRRAETLLGLPRNRIVGLRMEELGPPELAGARRPAALRPGLPFGAPAAQAYVWHRAGRRIPVDIISSQIEVGGRRVVQHIYRDITKRKRVEDALTRRNRQLEVLSRAHRQLHQVLEIPAILRALAGAALELAQCTGAMAGLLREGKLVFQEYHTCERAAPVDHQFDPGQGVAGYVLSSKLTYSSNDPARDPLVIPEIQAAYKLHNLVCVPILGRDSQLLGCLETHNTRDQRPIEESDLTMLEMLAASAALAIENARALSQHAALLEAVAEGVLVVDAEGRIVSFNQQFVRMWKIPADIMAARQDQRALDWVLQQLKDGDAFLSRVEQLYATPRAESHDLIEFKDGRLFERFSRPRIVCGSPDGRVWSFRDLTELMRNGAGRPTCLGG